MQYFFLLFFETLIAVLALFTLLLLVAVIWQVSQGANVTALLEGIGAVVSGVAAVWLLARQTDARTFLTAAQEGLAKYKC